MYLERDRRVRIEECLAVYVEGGFGPRILGMSVHLSERCKERVSL